MSFNKISKASESPLLELTNTAVIPAGGVFRISLEQFPYDKYLPFNFCMIQNVSAERVRFIVNDSVRFSVPAGVIQTFDSSTIPAVWSFQVNNLGANNIDENDIVVTFQKVKDVKTAQVKLFGGGI